jgi:transglutaminase-like putative cysteine protease
MASLKSPFAGPHRPHVPLEPDRARSLYRPPLLLHLLSFAFAGLAVAHGAFHLFGRRPMLAALAVLAVGALLGWLFYRGPAWLRLLSAGAGVAALAWTAWLFAIQKRPLIEVAETVFLCLILAQAIGAARPRHYALMGALTVVLTLLGFRHTGGAQVGPLAWAGLALGVAFLVLLAGSAPRDADPAVPRRKTVPLHALLFRIAAVLLIAVPASRLVWARMPTLRVRTRTRSQNMWVLYFQSILGLEQETTHAAPHPPSTPNNDPRFMRRFYAETGVLDLTLTNPELLGSRLLLAVEAEEACYLRGFAYDHYDGRAWRPARPTLFQPLRARHSAGLKVLFIPDKVRGAPLSGHAALVHVQAPLGAVFYLPCPPASVSTEGFTPLLRDQIGNVYAGRPLIPGDRYSVHLTQVPVAPLAAARIGVGDPPEISRQYLQLPPVSERFQRACEEAVGAETGRLRAALSLMGRVREGKQYSTEPARLPDGADAADYFLFEMDRGSCTHFATALTVACRAVGIPARLVTGFAPGTFNAQTRLYEVRERDSHAWTQVWFPEIGWTDLDASPAGIEMQSPASADARPQLLDVLRRFRARSARLWGAFTDALGRLRAWGRRHPLWPVHILAALVLAAAAFFAGRFALRRLRWRLRWLRAPRLEPRRAAGETYRCCLEWLRRAGLPFAPHRTPSELAAAAREAGFPWAPELARVTDTAQRLAFASEAPDPEGVHTLRTDVLRLRRELGRRPTVRSSNEG